MFKIEIDMFNVLATSFKTFMPLNFKPSNIRDLRTWVTLLHMNFIWFELPYFKLADLQKCFTPFRKNMKYYILKIIVIECFALFSFAVHISAEDWGLLQKSWLSLLSSTVLDQSNQVFSSIHGIFFRKVLI